MTESRKVLAQYKCAVINTYEAAYTVSSSPVDVEAVISSLLVCNIGTTTQNFRIAIGVAGAPAPPSDKAHLYYNVDVTKKNTFAATLGITLSQDDIVYFYVSSTNLVISLFGVELS